MNKVYVVTNMSGWLLEFKIPDTIFDMIREGDLISESDTKYLGHVSVIDFGKGKVFAIDGVSFVFDNFRDAVECAKQQLQKYSESLRIDCLLSEYKGDSNEEI